MIIFRQIFFIIILAALLVCCSETVPELSYEMVTVSKKSVKSDSAQAQATIELTYPIITFKSSLEFQKEMRDSIDKFILGELYNGEIRETPEKLLDMFLTEFDDFIKDFPEYHIGWYLNKTVNVLYSNNNVISISLFEDSFTGGAHPNAQKYYLNFDLVSKKSITLDDLIIAGQMDSLNSIAEKEFRKSKNIENHESLNQLGYWFEKDKFRLNKNFALTESGIHFYFNSYEIAPYSLGPTELILSYHKLNGIINIDKYSLNK